MLVHRDDRAVQSGEFRRVRDDAVFLQRIENTGHYPLFAPAIPPHVYGVPRTELFRQPAPGATFVHDMQQSIHDGQIRYVYIASLFGKIGFYDFKLLFRELHDDLLSICGFQANISYSKCVNTP